MLGVIPTSTTDPNNNEKDPSVDSRPTVQQQFGQLKEGSVELSTGTGLVATIHLWVVFCVYYIAACVRKLTELVVVQAELNKRSLKEQKLPEESSTETSDFSASGEMVKQAVVPKLHVTTLNAECWYPTIHKDIETVSLSIPSPRRRSAATTDSDDLVDSVELLLQNVMETKIITTVFEVRGAGVSFVLKDLRHELEMWFAQQGLLVICSEMVWSVPSGQRDPRSEIKLKQELFSALRHNNRRVLNVKFPRHRLTDPVCLPESTVEEASGRERSLNSYQGIYRRFYGALLPFQHEDAVSTHDPYWGFDRGELNPRPEQFLMGNNRESRELRTNCLVALNLVALKLEN